MSTQTVIDSLGVSLDEVINFYLDMFNLPQSQYDRISRLAIRGYRLFYRDSTGIPKEVTLPVLANGTSVLPVDAMSKLSVSVLNNRGERASLVYDQLLALTDVESGKREQQPTQEVQLTETELILSYPETQAGLQIGYGYGQFGIGSQPVLGFYNIDWGQRVIVYNFGFCLPEVIFGYLGLYDNNGEYYIHPFYLEALISWMSWQDMIGSRKVGIGEKREAERVFNVQYRNARFASSPFDASSIYNQWRQTLRLSPKS